MKLRLAASIAFGLLAGAATIPAHAAESVTGRPLVVRRITADQYRTTVTDIFGADIKFGGRFAPDTREGGLLAVGAGLVSVNESGLQQFDGMARSVSQQVVDEKHRDLLIPCKPASVTAPDDACATQFLNDVGRLLFRRPLTQAELQQHVQAASDATKTVKNFYTGLALSLEAMMDAPEFLFRQQVAEADPEHTGQYRLDAYSKAAQISYFLWNAEPDLKLLDAAAKGDLNTEKGLNKQVDRMMASPKFEGGVRAFFTDMLGFNLFETLEKDGELYPKFTPQTHVDAQEQTLRTLVDLLVTNNGDYRDIFTTRKTFLTPALGVIYGVPVVKTTPIMAAAEWVPHEYPEGDPRAGILSEISFVGLHSPPGRSSPTIRGKALREVMLCQKVPDPPANVNFTVVQDTSNPQYKTTRERLTAHRTDAVCAGCHKLIDPMGLAMENFDGAGSFRTKENGAPIDASGELDGVKFNDALGLGRAMHDSPSASACVVNRAFAYAIGRAVAKDETQLVKSLEKDFTANKYSLPNLFRRIAASPELYRVSPAQTGALDAPVVKQASTAP